MEPAPLPPHERTWRHPSELAAGHRADLVRERPSATARTLALLTGTAGIVLIGIAMMSLSPRGGQAPPIEGAAGAAGSDSVVLTTLASIKSRQFEIEMIPLVTPLDRGALAIAPSRTILQVLTRRAESESPRRISSGDPSTVTVRPNSTDAGERPTITVRLGNGTTRTAVVIDSGAGSDLALMELVAVEDPEDRPMRGHPVAALMPSSRELVTVLTEKPVTVTFAAVPTLGVADGTAVINADGQLVGVCWREPEANGGSGFIPIDSMYADATTAPDQPPPP